MTWAGLRLVLLQTGALLTAQCCAWRAVACTCRLLVAFVQLALHDVPSLGTDKSVQIALNDAFAST